jgi:cytochrome c oxidase cbb3-type subunit III
MNVSSHYLRVIGRAGWALLFLFSLLGVSCKREQRQFEPPPTAANVPVIMSDLQPGAPKPQAPMKNSLEENATALSDGKRLFSQYNCTGCHANGGGAIGPALMDEQWIYGSDPANIYSTIVEGRPNGMPSFRNKISDYQVWELAAYVRSLSGQVRKDVAPGRGDDMNVHRSEQRVERKTPEQSAVPKSAEQP